MAANSEQVIFATFTYIALFVVICCLLLHLKNHFGFAMMTKSSKRNDICCCLYPLNGHIEFYPVSTLCYFIFLVISISLIITLEHEYYINLFDDNLIEISCPILPNVLSLIHNPLQLTSLSIPSNNNTQYIWSYIVLSLVLWETLFNFYRFYDASFMERCCRNAPKRRIFSLFSIYTFFFSLFYMAQIHVYYGLLVIIVLMHFIFNTYCIVGFVAILNTQYEHLWQGEPEAIKNHQIIKELLHITNRVKVCSVITTILSTSFLFIINGCYTSSTIILLPGLFMISSVVWALNFAKNECWFHEQYQSLFTCFGSLCMMQTNNNNSDNSNKNKHRNPNVIKLKSSNSAISGSPSTNASNDHDIDMAMQNMHEMTPKSLKSETSLPVTMTTMNIGPSETMQTDDNFDDIHHDPKPILPVFSYTHSKSMTHFTLNHPENDITTFPIPQEFEIENIQSPKSVSNTKSKKDVDENKESEERKSNEGPGAIPKIEALKADITDYDDHDHDDDGKIETHSPLTPFSRDTKHHFDVNMARFSISNMSAKSNGQHQRCKSNGSITPGPMRRDFNFGLDMPRNPYLHRRSMSAMSGITASPILNMMVNQGFGLDSANNVRNVAL